MSTIQSIVVESGDKQYCATLRFSDPRDDKIINSSVKYMLFIAIDDYVRAKDRLSWV